MLLRCFIFSHHDSLLFFFYSCSFLLSSLFPLKMDTMWDVATRYLSTYVSFAAQRAQHIKRMIGCRTGSVGHAEFYVV